MGNFIRHMTPRLAVVAVLAIPLVSQISYNPQVMFSQIGGTVATSQLATVQGNGTKVQLATGAAGSTGNGLKFDASGNIIDAGGAYALTSALPLQATTTSIGGGALLAGACASSAVTVTGATTSMSAVASPAAGVDPTNGGVLGVAISARVSSANTVTVSVCAPIAGTPAAATYRVTVTQ